MKISYSLRRKTSNFLWNSVNINLIVKFLNLTSWPLSLPLRGCYSGDGIYRITALLQSPSVLAHTAHWPPPTSDRYCLTMQTLWNHWQLTNRNHWQHLYVHGGCEWAREGLKGGWKETECHPQNSLLVWSYHHGQTECTSLDRQIRLNIKSSYSSYRISFTISPLSFVYKYHSLPFLPLSYHFPHFLCNVYIQILSPATIFGIQTKAPAEACIPSRQYQCL